MSPTVAALIGFAVLPAALIVLERTWPSVPARTVIRRGAVSDAVWYVVEAFVARAVAPWAVYVALVPLMIALGMSAAEFFQGFGPAARIAFWWQVPIVLVIADFLSYWQHRLFHTRALWPIHAVHHSSRELDWLSSGRFHPLNEIGLQLVNVVPVLACGFHAATFLVIAPFTTWYVVFLHANLGWTFGPLRHVIASPAFHRWHHTSAEEGLDKNFGGIFPWWDHLFGTFYMPSGRTASVFGTSDPVPNGFVGQLAYPLVPVRWRRLLAPAVLLVASAAHATTYTVAPSGSDFTRIQDALDVAVAGDTVSVREAPAPYFEKLAFPRSGDVTSGAITLTAHPGEHPILDGTGVVGEDMIRIDGRSWITVRGLDIRNDLGVSDGSGIRITGSGSRLELRDNVIHDIRGQNAMGITVYATESTPISDLVIAGNTIHDCEPAPSEALTLNGNVDGFAVTDNVVRDVNNIGIDFIGGEKDIQPDTTKVARNGVCRGNRVERARSIYGGGFAAGIYVDGGRDIVIERNVVTESDVGLEVASEHAGIEARFVSVRDNVLFANDKAGLAFGGYASSVGRTRDSTFTNNTVVGNDTLGAGFGQLWIQYAEDNVVRSNVFVSGTARRLLDSDAGNAGNSLDDNVWWTPGALAGAFVWNGTEYATFAAYVAATGADAHSLFTDPLFVDAGAADFHLSPTSPAINAGDPAYVAAPGETDLDGAPRVSGPRVDAGADEVTCGDGVPNPGEECDDGDTVDGDGCDSNCTTTRCGNGIVTTGEACDDGNLAAGDCCDGACQFESAGAACDDGDACTPVDGCDGAGGCTSSATPRSGCHAAGTSSIALKHFTPATKDRLTWKWLRGDTTFAELGDPISGATGFTLCAYDTTAGTPHVVLRSAAPGGGTCRGKPCWKPISTIGFKYADRDLTPDGLLGINARGGVAGRARITVKGKADRLGLPMLPLAQSPRVVVQLVATTGVCWESVHTAPATKNDASQFRDAGD